MAEDTPAGPIAIVDIGSNSIRLVIYEGATRAPVARFDERHFCALGREVARTGSLGPAGTRCARESLARFVAIARSVGCEAIDLVGTAALRVASDGPAFASRTSRALGLPVTILDGEEEGRYAALGVLCGFHQPRGIMGDLGGGSVELAPVPAGTGPIAAPVSLPLGALLLTDAAAGSREEAERLVAATLRERLDLRGAARGGPFFVVGGSWRALARARMALRDEPLKVLHGYALGAAEAERMGRSLAAMDAREIGRLPAFPKRRAETLPAAGILLAAIVRHLEPERVVFSATGLREGRLFAMLPPAVQAQDPLLEGAAALGRLASRDPAMAPELIRLTDGLFPGETADERRLRHATCQLADTGWRDHPGTRAIETFHRLVQYPFLGIGHAERVALALAVATRYEGHADEPCARRILALLPESSLARWRALGQALELVLEVSGGVPAVARSMALDADGSLLRLTVHHPDATSAGDVAIEARLAILARSLGRERVQIVTG